MILESDPLSKFLLGYAKLILFIIIVYKVPYWEVYILGEFGGDIKVKLIIIAPPMSISTQLVKDKKPSKQVL